MHHQRMAIENNPIQRFNRLFEQIRNEDQPESTAMVLATATPAGRPAARVVLLKACDERGFVFYTNLHSRKGRELEENPFAALCFYWQPIATQVRVEGRIERVTESEADVYFASRPRGSQLGAWASRQSEVLPTREELLTNFEKYKKEFEGQEVPRPDFWSGYRLVPAVIEFWHGLENRLHERYEYRRTGNEWQVILLNP